MLSAPHQISALANLILPFTGQSLHKHQCWQTELSASSSSLTSALSVPPSMKTLKLQIPRSSEISTWPKPAMNSPASRLPTLSSAGIQTPWHHLYHTRGWTLSDQQSPRRGDNTSPQDPSRRAAGQQEAGGREWCGKAAGNTVQGFHGEHSTKLQSFGVYNRKQCSLPYLQELALQEAANYMSHLNLFIQLRQSTFQSHKKNVSKIVPGQKCKCIHFLSEQIKTKYHTGTTPRFPPPHGIRLTDLVYVVRLNICSSTKLPLRRRSKEKKLFLSFLKNLLWAKILDFGDVGNKSIDMIQKGTVLKPEFWMQK